MASTGSSQMTFGDAGGAHAMPAADGALSTGNDSSANSSGGGAQGASTTFWSQENSPAPTITNSPRVDISPRARPSIAPGSGGNPAKTGSVPLERPLFLPPLEQVMIDESAQPVVPMMVVPMIRGMSSTGQDTSGNVPEAAYLGTPKGQPNDGRRSRSPPKDKAIKDVPVTPDWIEQAVVSHRGSGSVPMNMPEMQVGFPSGGNSAGLARVTRSPSSVVPPALMDLQVHQERS